jgi:hypothetical protein
VSRNIPALVLSVAVALPGGACGRSAREAGTEGPWLEVEWSGSDSGRVEGSAMAEWCDSLHLLEIRAIHGDTGVGIAIYPRKQFETGSYPVVPAARADSAPPGAAVALRWFAETAIRGFQADSGNIAVQESPAGVYAGAISAFAHSVTDGGRLSIRGSFRRLAVRPTIRGCLSRSSSGASTPGVH